MLMDIRRTYSRADEELAPRTGLGWVNSLGLSANYLPPGIEGCSSKPNREALFRMVADKQQDTMALCATIFAWGGMHVRHGRELFRAGAKWRETAETVRFGNLNRAEAYALFHKLRADGALPGMGPAYFTKLVFFLRGSALTDPGYIMDQWTGCSVNLLTGDPCTVLMNATYAWDSPTTLRSDFQVSDKNDAQRYERFCAVIDGIADAVGLDPVDAELLLMSQGRGRGAWRRHVLAHRQVPSIASRQRTAMSQSGVDDVSAETDG
ncbi:MAG: hypothetical protein E7K72_20995 [Roseomonas mucosa]|nr:hypothetical protein [Roseomonas mucosa]